jgi:hypothetical protein
MVVKYKITIKKEIKDPSTPAELKELERYEKALTDIMNKAVDIDKIQEDVIKTLLFGAVGPVDVRKYIK